MSRIAFVKAHACGNDFLIIEESLAHNNHAAMARKLCSRNTGIGADGIEFLQRRPDGTLFLRLFNADGSEAELSGNGTRCVAAWLAATEGLQHVSLGTHGGVRTCRLLRRDDADYWIESGMGIPRVLPCSIEIPGLVTPIIGAMVNVGNPHFVVFIDNQSADIKDNQSADIKANESTDIKDHEDFSSHGLPWQDLGAIIAVHPLFPFGTNVEFVRILSPNQIAFRIYERGCGPTTSSGTGTCASSAAAIVLRGAARELSAVAQGGAQQVVWPTNDSEMLLTGPAEIICTGEVDFA